MQINNCSSIISGYYENIILISAFILGFIICKYYIFKESKINKPEKERLSKLTEEYLEKYRQENEDFFFTS